MFPVIVSTRDNLFITIIKIWKQLKIKTNQTVYEKHLDWNGLGKLDWSWFRIEFFVNGGVKHNNNCKICYFSDNGEKYNIKYKFHITLKYFSFRFLKSDLLFIIRHRLSVVFRILVLIRFVFSYGRVRYTRPPSGSKPCYSSLPTAKCRFRSLWNPRIHWTNHVIIS